MSDESTLSNGGARLLIPHLVVKGASEAIAFYVKALGATELFRLAGPGGAVIHATLMLGESKFYLAEEPSNGMTKAPASAGGTEVTLHVDVDDVDAAYARAVDAGATPAMPPADMFWGDRYGQVVDPFGHRWSLATRVEEISPEAMQERLAAMFAGGRSPECEPQLA